MNWPRLLPCAGIAQKHFRGPRSTFLLRQIHSNTTPKSIAVAYASQSGTAHLFAEQLAEEVGDMVQVPVSLMPANDLKDKLQAMSNDEAKNSIIFILAACYGRGEPPENAIAFYDSIVNKKDPISRERLADIRYAVFGLGSSKTHTDYYNVVGQNLDRELASAGATRVLDLALGDDSGDIDEDFEVFLENAKNKVSQIFSESEPAIEAVSVSVDSTVEQTEMESNGVAENTTQYQSKVIAPESTTQNQYNVITPPCSKLEENIFPMHLTHLEQLTAGYEDNPDRCVFEMRLESVDHDKHFKFDSGDYLLILPENDNERIEQFCERFSVSPDMFLPKVQARLESTAGADQPPTLRNLLRYSFDFTQPVSSRALQLIGTALKESHDPNAVQVGEEILELRSDKARYQEEIVGEHISVDEFLEGWVLNKVSPDVVKVFQQVQFMERLLATGVSKLCERCYSISSTESAGKHGVLEVTFRYVSYETPKLHKHVKGVATSYLYNLCESTTEPKLVHVKVRSGTFKLGHNFRQPIIMVAGGIGIAPFRAFMLERLEAMQFAGKSTIGPGYLFYGTKNAHDRAYTDLIRDSLNRGTLNHAFFAHDEDVEPIPGSLTHDGISVAVNQYIPETFLHQGALVWEVLQNDHSRIYLCGGVSGFGEAMVASVKKIAMQHGGMNEEEAEAYFRHLVQTNRYLEDLAD